jgi:hypothetical protein
MAPLVNAFERKNNFGSLKIFQMRFFFENLIIKKKRGRVKRV